MIQKRENIRNAAIIAHVDHGKTTLVDQLLHQTGAFRKNQVVAERVMDSNDLERERGITILSKNTAVTYKGVKINIIDTPGHADFGGEVERVLKMVDGVVLVVDAFEGPMPQTKFVLKNALDLALPVVVYVNKTDRPEARPAEVVDETLELFMELDANDEQLDSPFVFGSAKRGTSSLDAETANDARDDGEIGMTALFDKILEWIPAPTGDAEKYGQALISTIDYNEYVGRIGVGKIENGFVGVNDEAYIVNVHEPGKLVKVKISKLFEFDGLERVDVSRADIGSIVAISGIDDIHIGDTVCVCANGQTPEPLPFARISEPTISMSFVVNDSPFAGTEGKFVTSRHLRDRLFKELNTDVSLRVEETSSTDAFKVSGRGELHLSILIETMRREGYEFAVSKPEVLYHWDEDGKKLEPMELVTIDAPEESVGVIIEKLGGRKGEMTYMAPSKGGYTRVILSVPSRGLIGYRTEFLTDTKGAGIMNSVFDGFKPFKGDIPIRAQGSLISFETGEAVPYGMYNAQERGELFVSPGDKVYAGMVVGRCARAGDIEVNICKRKQLTNMRSSASDDSLRLTPAAVMSLERCIEFISDDELVEVTPKSLRIRKKTLDSGDRKRAGRNIKN